MISKWLLYSFLLFLVQGCQHLADATVAYREVWLENTVDVDITSVATGRRGDGCSEFGVLGSKGAGKVAGVPIRFVSDFLIQWEENFDGVFHQTVVDLRRFKGVENRAIILRYKGNDKWETQLGRTIRPTTNQ